LLWMTENSLNMNQPLMRGIITAGFFVGAIYLGLKVGNGELFFPVLIMVGIIGLLILDYSKIAVFAAFALLPSQLSLPYIPSQLNLHYVATLFLFAVVPVYVLMRRTEIQFNALHALAAAFCGLLVILISVRGFGLRIFGSDLIGGLRYFHIFSATVLLFSVSVIPIPPKWWSRLIVLICVGSLVPFAADIAIVRDWAVEWVIQFVKASEQTLGASYLESRDPITFYIMRFYSGKPASAWIALGLLCFVRPRLLFGSSLIKCLPVLACIVLLAAASGFRIAFVTLFLIFLFAGLLDRSFTVTRLCSYSVMGLLAVMVVFNFIHLLPLSFQRSLSFIPGLKGNVLVVTDAIGTVNWRFEVWKQAVYEIPHYLLIGKGLAFSMSDYVYGQTDQIDWALRNSSYHNGPLSALILTGLPGTLLIVAMTFFASVRHYQQQQRDWVHDNLKQFHLAFYAYFLTATTIFFLVYGDVQVSVPQLLRLVAFLEGLVVSDRVKSFGDFQGALKEEGADRDMAHASFGKKTLHKPSL